jgi:hypothetical protein
VPISTTGAALTTKHRRDQANIRAAFGVDFLTAWRLLDPFQLDPTTAAWLAVVEQLVSGWRRTSATTTAGYYTAHRGAELAALDTDQAPPLRLVVDGGPDPAALRTSLLVTGPVTIKRLSGHGVPVPEAARVAAVRAEAAAARHVLDGGRATMRATIAADPVALGWARVTDANPCWLCAMAASRGPVYKTRDTALFLDRTGGQPWHDGCGCTAEPIYSRDADWPGDGRNWARLWEEATAGLSGEEARRAFRRAVDAQRGTGTPTGTGIDRAPDGTGTAATRDPEPEPTPQRPTEPEAEAGTEAEPEGGRADWAEPEPDPLGGIDLAELSDEELFDLFGEVSAQDDPPESALWALDAEMARREEAAAPPPPAESDPLDGVDLAELAEDELYRLWNAHPHRADTVAAIGAELDRRDQAAATSSAPLLDDDDAELTEEQRRVDDLVARGWDYLDAYAEVYQHDPAELARQQRAAALDADRRAGETRDQTARRMYDEWVRTQLLAAEDATRGNLLTKAAQAAGIKAVELFSGPAARARKWASEDLKRWWADGNPRLTYTEFRAELLGRDTDRQAAELIRAQGNDRDFGL